MMATEARFASAAAADYATEVMAAPPDRAMPADLARERLSALLNEAHGALDEFIRRTVSVRNTQPRPATEAVQISARDRIGGSDLTMWLEHHADRTHELIVKIHAALEELEI